MSETVWLALITGLPATLTALAGLIISMRGRAKLGEQQKQMHEENTAAIVANKNAVQKLDEYLNGNLEKIVANAVAAAIAKERLDVARKNQK
jgi:hypothetical protein